MIDFKEIEVITKRRIERDLFPVPVPENWKELLMALRRDGDTMLDLVERFCAGYRWTSEAHEAFVKRLGLDKVL